MMTHATVVVFLLVYRCLLPFILLRAQQRHHRFKEGGGKTSTRTKTILSSCIFSFILQSSSSVARHVPSRFRIIVGFQRARLFLPLPTVFERRRRRTTTAGAAVFAQRARKIHSRRKKRENDRFPVDRARWFPRAHRVSSFLKHAILMYIQASKV